MEQNKTVTPLCILMVRSYLKCYVVFLFFHFRMGDTNGKIKEVGHKNDQSTEYILYKEWPNWLEKNNWGGKILQKFPKSWVALEKQSFNVCFRTKMKGTERN